MAKELNQEELNNREEVAHIAVERFFNRYIPIEDAKGNPTGDVHTVEMVEWVKKGTHITIGQRTPMRITQAKTDRSIWAVVGPLYENWKRGQDAPINGTPLAAWAGLVGRPDLAERLKLIHVKSVEDVAAMTDGDIDHFGMGGLKMREDARAFVTSKKSADAIRAQVEAQLGAKDDELKETKAQLAANGEQIAALQAQLEAIMSSGEPRKPGRPRKQAA